MKTRFGLLFLTLSMNAFGQFTVAPFGSSQTNFPIGNDRKNQCPNSGCGFEIVMKPFCFGTNLRAYPVAHQMDPTQPVTARLTFSGKNNSKDSVDIKFPASMTYPSAGSQIDCTFKEGENMDLQGSHSMACFIPWQNKSYTYTLREWMERKNPGIASTYNYYAGIGLPATLDSSQGDQIDKEITCLYRFTKHRGDLVKSAVSCYFPSTLPDLSSAVSVVKDGAVVPAEVTAYTNTIKVRLPGGLKSLAAEGVPVKHGQMVIETPPKHEMVFLQPATATSSKLLNAWSTQPAETSTQMREITSVKEKASFDETNSFRTFSTQVKFPGMQGFCGGYYSPLMLFFDEKLPKFNGISAFKLYGMPEGSPVNWPERNAPGYFLVYLKEGEKEVTSFRQLFGQTDEFENGFEALKPHDANKDGQIDSKDPIFSKLYLWADKNSDGYSQPEELSPISSRKVSSIKLKYSNRDATNFDNRARVREKGKFTFLENGKEKSSNIYDVWFSPLQQ